MKYKKIQELFEIEKGLLEYELSELFNQRRFFCPPPLKTIQILRIDPTPNFVGGKFSAIIG